MIIYWHRRRHGPYAYCWAGQQFTQNEPRISVAAAGPEPGAGGGEFIPYYRRRRIKRKTKSVR